MRTPKSLTRLWCLDLDVFRQRSVALCCVSQDAESVSSAGKEVADSGSSEMGVILIM